MTEHLNTSPKSIKINVLINIIYTLSNILFPMITFPYISRILNIDLMGRISFFSSLTNCAIMFSSLGISTYGIRAAAKARKNNMELAKVVQELFIINLFAAIFVILAFLASTLFIERFRNNIVLLIMSLIQILFAPLGMNWLFNGLEEYAYITKSSLFFKFFSLIATFMFIKEQKHYIIYAAITTFSAILLYIRNFMYARKFFIYSLGKLNFRRHFRPMFLLFASILAINIYTHLDTIMLGFISGDLQVGLYTIAVYVKTALLILVNAISHTLLPRLSFYISNKDEQKLNQILSKSITIILIIAFPLTIFFIIEAENIALLLSGKGIQAARCMQIIMPILLISGISNITGNQILIPRGKDNYFLKAVICGAIVDLIFNALLMPKYKAIGAALATLIAEFVQMSIQIMYAKEYFYKNVNFRSVLSILISSFFSGLILMFLRGFIHIEQVILQVIINSFLFFSVYCAALFFTGEQEFAAIFSQIRNKMIN